MANVLARRPAAGPAAGRSGTGWTRRRARGSARLAAASVRRGAGAAADSLRCPGSRSAQPSAASASTRSPMGRSCMRGTPDSSNSPPSRASAAVSGRMAVPALPMNSLARASCCSLPAQAADDGACCRPARRRSRAAPQRGQHHGGVVGVEQVVDRGVAVGSGRPAAARGWKCSWSRAGGRCRPRCAAAECPGTRYRTWRRGTSFACDSLRGDAPVPRRAVSLACSIMASRR